MPIYLKKSNKGHYFQYGKSGKKYYFKINSIKSANLAYSKALRQTKAIHANK